MAARNDFGVTVPALALPLTKTYHGMTLIDNQVASWDGSQSYTPKFAERANKLVYELNAYIAWGRPIDRVPGIESGRTLSCERIEVWDEEIELTFGPQQDIARAGGVEWIDLCEQTRPFVFQEALFRANTRYRTWEYLGCWFLSKDLNAKQAEGDAIVIATCEMGFVIRKTV